MFPMPSLGSNWPRLTLIKDKLVEVIRHPPWPLASRRVDASNQHQTLQTSQNLQTNLLGGGFTLPLPPPRRSGPASCSFSENALCFFNPFKNALKTNRFLTFPVFGPTKPVHVCMTHASHMKFDVDMLKVTSK